MRTPWPWLVRAYYSDTAAAPFQPGVFATEIGGVSKEALALDVECLRRRPEIGAIIGPFEVTVFTTMRPPPLVDPERQGK